MEMVIRKQWLAFQTKLALKNLTNQLSETHQLTGVSQPVNVFRVACDDSMTNKDRYRSGAEYLL
jgi:hypothetical protein